MDKEEKRILRENREGKGFPIILYLYPPYRAALYIVMYMCIHTSLLPPYIVIYMCIYTLLLPHCCPYIWLCLRVYIPYYCPITTPMGPIYTPIYNYICAYTYPITTLIWPIYTRMYTLLSGIKIRIIRKAVKKRQALYLIWTSVVIGYILE